MDASRLVEIAEGFKAARALQVATSLGLFEGLRSGPCDAARLAANLRLSSAGVERLADLLVGLEILSKDAAGYGLTEVARRCLLADGPNSVTSLVTWMEQVYRGMAYLPAVVAQGRPIAPAVVLDERGEWVNVWMGAMDELAQLEGRADAIAAVVDLGDCERLLDLGGGPGTYARAFCRRYPRLRATVLERESICPHTLRRLRGHPEAARVEVVSGDYRRPPLPGPFDAALISNVLHSNTREDNLALLRAVFDALVPGGRLVIRGLHTDESGTRPIESTLVSLTLLVYSHGRSYRASEVSTWLMEAGFVDVHAIDDGNDAPQLLLARRPNEGRAQ
jgi:SAM-dependent methyltransferase